MKNNKFLITICAMVVAIIISITVVSCKKETQGNMMNNKNESVQTFNPREIEDMNAYLKGFKQKMQSATKGDDETLSLEEAAWHLSSLANYEFANANVECDDVRFDTLYAHVNITNGTVLLSDLAEAYQTVSSSIEKFYNGLALDNKHFRFINAIISENGEIVIPLLTTFSRSSKDLVNNLWYFDDVFTLWDICDSIFPDTIVYSPQSTGKDALVYQLSQVCSHSYILIGEVISVPVYYTLASTKSFNYYDYIDEYGSPFYNYRLFYHNRPFVDDLWLYNLCYLYDSYLGLGFDNCPTGQEILSWEIMYRQNPPQTIEYHTLKVNYGIRHEIGSDPGHNF